MNEPTRYKFVVSSADEAVKVLRERLGENAKVISVRQVEGAGLSRFLRAPKLEVIAQVSSAAPEPETVPAITPIEPARAVGPAPAISAPSEPEPAASERVLAEDSPLFPEADTLPRILRRAGFTPPMLARLENSANWQAVVRLPLNEALAECAVLLRIEYRYHPQFALGDRVAFIGTAGTGKTTALCKQLAADVFLRQRRARVLKLEMERANSNDALAVFCDALGVPMTRSVEDVQALAEDERLYVDVPGVNANDPAEIGELHLLLARHAIDTRVLVVNAAYESAAIKNAYALGEAVCASHVVFTHVDELAHWGKLWEFVLTQRLTPLFLSTGQNIAADCETNVFDEVLARTFPASGSGLAEHVEAA
jgi:flagellar biosynthesis protein FlhF